MVIHHQLSFASQPAQRFAFETARRLAAQVIEDALIEEIAHPASLDDWIAAVKSCRIVLERPRPISEAISSAGGVPWDQLTDDLMLRSLPGIFCAGEMIDWEAPTGGYLMQGCFVTGTIAGEGAAKWIAKGS